MEYQSFGGPVDGWKGRNSSIGVSSAIDAVAIVVHIFNPLPHIIIINQNRLPMVDAFLWQALVVRARALNHPSQRESA